VFTLSKSINFIILLTAIVFSKNQLSDFYELYLKTFDQNDHIDSIYNAIYQVLVKEYQITDTSLVIICPGFKPNLVLPEKHSVYYSGINDLRYLNHFSETANSAIMFEFIESQTDSVNYNFLVSAFRKLYKIEKYVFWEQTISYFELSGTTVKKYSRSKKTEKLKVKMVDLNEL
jgi:hypothetical protein